MAGSWAGEVISKDGFYAGRARVVTEISNEFTADASLATIPDWDSTYDCAFLVGFGCIYDGTTPPDSLTITVKDADGLTVATASATSASGRGTLTAPVPLINGFTVSLSDNTTNSAKGTVKLLVIPNVR